MTRLESKSQRDDSTSYEGGQQESTSLYSRKSLIQRLKRGEDARTKFVESNLDKKIAFQIRALRGDLSQEEVERKSGIKQQAQSRLENPYYGKATLSTLKRIAATFDVGLIVEFVPFSRLIDEVIDLSPEDMTPPSFDEEEHSGAFDERLEPQSIKWQDFQEVLTSPAGGNDPSSQILPQSTGEIKRETDKRDTERTTRKNPRRRMPKGSPKSYQPVVKV